MAITAPATASSYATACLGYCLNTFHAHWLNLDNKLVSKMKYILSLWGMLIRWGTYFSMFSHSCSPKNDYPHLVTCRKKVATLT